MINSKLFIIGFSGPRTVNFVDKYKCPTINTQKKRIRTRHRIYVSHFPQRGATVVMFFAWCFIPSRKLHFAGKVAIHNLRKKSSVIH